jgi:hypothetical protein
MPSPTPANSTLPGGIEIFRPGRHTDDSGTVHSFTEADVAGMAASYSPALREAPLTVGHPRDNLPAYGWVKSLTRNAAGALAIEAHQVEPQFAEMVSAGRFKKRSASFYPPQAPNNPTPGRWYLRHVAFLGAQPPAIAGLKDIQFSEGDTSEGAVSFSEAVSTTPATPVPPATATATATATPPPPEQDPMDEELKAQLAQAKKDLADAQAATAAATQKATAAEAQAASFAEQARADRKAGFVSFAQAQVQAGKLLPKDEAMAVATLQALADAQPVEFAEGDATRKVSPAQWLQDLLASAPPAVSFGEFAPGKGSGQIQPGSARGKSDAEIDTAARSFMRAHKVDYAEALTAVTSSFTS